MNNKTGGVGKEVKLERDKSKIIVNADIAFSKRWGKLGEEDGISFIPSQISEILDEEVFEKEQPPRLAACRGE